MHARVRSARLRRASAALGITAMLALLATSAAAAPADAAQDARDAAAVNAVKLDMDLVTRIERTNQQAGAALQQTCLVGRGPAADKDKGIEACGDTLERTPSIKAALAANGLRGRQFALGVSALIAAEMAGRGVLENEKEGWDGVRELGVNPAHVRFYLAHRAEIERLEAAGQP